MQPFCLGCYFGYAEVHAGTSEDTALIIVITPECNVEWLLQLVLLEGLTLLRIINDYDYVCAQNGLVAYKDGKLIGTQSLRSYLGEEKLKEERDEFEKYDKTYCLRYVDDFHEIHFFGDRTYKVTSLEDTVKQCTALFLTKQVDVY
ncbi:unnamed protein product [Camellia sinensis]